VSSDHPNADAIFYVKSEGIVEGYADGTFKPDRTINRAEFVKILMGASEDDGRMCKIAPFSDVDQTAWYATYAHKARCQGVVEGYPDGTFKPAASINFAEAAKILVKAYGLEAVTTIPACEEGDCPWYRGYVLMLEMKAAIPTSIESFDQPITRGEMAEMIYRLKTDNNDKPSKTYDGLAAQHSMRVTVYTFVWNENDTCGYGCDQNYAARSVTVPASENVLRSSLEALFDVSDDFESTELTVTSAVIVDGVAKIRIDGELRSAGIGQDARMEQEIERTIRQFPSVKSLDIVIAGTPWRCFGDESGMCE
jgi:hypothetical protein